MNEQANTRLVRQAYQSVIAGDFQSFLNALGKDVQWQLLEMANVPFAGTWRGREQVGRFFSTVAQAQDVIEFEPELWAVSLRASNLRAAFPYRFGRMFGPSKMAK
jgi:ketosteroid isomerase-like protein